MIRCADHALPHGITLSCRSSGVQGPSVLFLHGFPEAAFVWDEVMAGLGPGRRCLAPNLRGYERSSAPVEVQAYRASPLVADVAALIEQDGAPVDLLVAHDWGGALAWNLAAQRPDLLKQLLIINSPHPAAFLRELRGNPAQRAASAYMDFLQRPDAEARLAADDFARLWPFLASPWRELSKTQRARYAAVWRQGLQGPLNYYRASPLRPGGLEVLSGFEFAVADVRVSLPTTVLWGEADTALLPGLLSGLDRWVPRVQVERVADASHWIVHEQPQRVRDCINLLLGEG